MQKNNDYLATEFTLIAFENEETPRAAAETITQATVRMAEPVFPVNGRCDYNEVQREWQRKWLIEFYDEMILRATHQLKKLKGEIEL